MSAVALGVGRGSPMVSNSADWLLRDEFISDLAAGSVNGTAAEPGPGTRVVVDTGNRLSLSKGNALFAAGATPEFSLRYGAISRAPGRMVIGSVSKSNIGLTVGTASATSVFAVRYDNGFSLLANWGGPLIQGPVTDSTIARAIVVRSSGYFVLLRLNGSWLFRWIDDITIPNADPFYPGMAALFAGYPSATADFIRVPDALWLPTPLASDGFGSVFGTTDGLGHAEGVAGGIGAGGGGVTWSNVGGTWSVSGGKAINTVPSGLSQQMSVAQVSTADVFASAALTRAAGSVGLAVSMDSASSPANGVLVYLDGTNCKVDKIVGGTTSNVRTTAVTYSAGARLVVAKNSSEYRVYYNNALVTAQTISDASIVNNTLHGLFSTDASNTFDNFVCYATGSGGEYAELDKWS